MISVIIAIVSLIIANKPSEQEISVNSINKESTVKKYNETKENILEITLENIIYEIEYCDGIDGGTGNYRFYIDENYRVQVQKTIVTSTMEADVYKNIYEMKISENNKKYLKDILDNLNESNEKTENNESGPIDFIITDKETNKTYLIKNRTKEYMMFEKIFIFEKEIN